MDNLEQCYQILGVSSDVSVDEVKQAYKDLVQVWHPDRYAHNPRLQRKAEAELKAINSAYEIIMESLASDRNVTKTTNVYKNESSSTQVYEREPVVKVKTNLLSKVKFGINKNKWILITVTGASILISLISLQIYAYTKYKDFTFFDPILLIQRVSSSSFLERNILGDEFLGSSRIKFSSNGAIFSDGFDPEDYNNTEIKIWDFHSGKKLKSFSVKNLRPPTSREDAIIAINLELKYLVSRHDEEIKVWNIDNNQLMRTVNLGDPKYIISNIVVTKNSEYFIIFYKSSNYLTHPDNIKLYDLKNGKLIRPFGDESISPETILHISDDGRIMIWIEEKYNGSFEREKKLKIWNIKTGQEHIVDQTLNEKDWDQSFSVINSDVTQNLLRTKSERKSGRSYLEVRQLDTGKLISVTDLNCDLSDSSVLRPDKISPLRPDKISPDGKLLVNVDKSNSSDSKDFSIEVCDLTNGERVHTLSKIAEDLNVEFSPDSKILAIGSSNSQNQTIELYNLETGKIDQSFIDAPNWSSTLTFTPDGRFLLTGSKNGMRIWRIR